MVFRCGESKALERVPCRFRKQRLAEAAAGRRPGLSFRFNEFLVGSESNVRHRQPQAQGLVRPSVAWCFGVARPRFWGCESCNLELISCPVQKATGHRQPQAEGLVRPSGAWRFDVARPKFWS